MFERPEETRADRALREGLRQIPVPETSADFAAQIQAKLHQPIPAVPKRQSFWMTLRPALASAAFSLVVTLALLPRLTQTPSTSRITAENTATMATEASALERFAERADLSGASLRGLPPVRQISTSRRIRHGHTQTL